MAPFRGIGLLIVLSLLFSATHADAQAWENERYHLSMQSPADWVTMNDALLAQTNASVSHVTGRGFIAGYALRDTNTLVFPYMLVQFKPYAALPERYRPLAKPDEHGQLELLYAMVGAFRQRGELTDDIDTAQFIDRFGNDHARLNRLDEDGRFDFAGKIPHEVGQDPIRYHTHGVFGKDGIAMVSVFAIDDFSSLNEVIQGPMRTLQFANAFALDALPDEPPQPEPADEPTSEPADNQDDQSQPTDAATELQTPEEPQAQPTDTAPDEPIVVANDSVSQADSTALIVILSLLGVGLIAAVFITWFVTHKKAQAKRERQRARRERILAAQAGSAPANSQPRPAAPPRAKSPGSSDRRTHGTTRS